MSIFYNEFNPESAAMIRQFMADGLIAPGIVDERSITELDPDELKQYTQCHFFAGIAGWTFALQLAGWPADRPVWTGSCPCQPFSSAGRQKGKEDDRHLWPVWERLIGECRPASIYGEQVASAIAHGWLDDVYQGLEAHDYAIGSSVLPACSIGSPHKRYRLWFVGHTEMSERQYTGETWAGRIGPTGSDSTLAQERKDGKSRNDQLPPSGPWGTGQWIDCPDGKKRLVEPGIPLLADGFQFRRPVLHGFGNAIVPYLAAQFIEATA